VTVAIGVDPGANCGIGIVEILPRARFRWLDGLMLSRSARPHHLALLIERWEPALVAMETPVGFIHEHFRGKDLLEAGVIAGQLIDRARTCGVEVVEASASTWRKALTGRGNASDKEIEIALRARCDDFPKRSSVHARDGAGVAAWALLEQRLRVSVVGRTRTAGAS
jgi:Holliday junction resolvasome RuvABC endonuclease subunit